MEINCEHVGSEINPAFVQIVDENDLVIVCHLEVELSGKERGAIDVVYPCDAEAYQGCPERQGSGFRGSIR